MKFIVAILVVFIGVVVLPIWFLNSKESEIKVSSTDTKLEIVKLAERAYADGQRDAMEGVIRIEIVNDSQIVFIKSPWDNCSDESKYYKCDVRFYDTVTTSKRD
jgi:hypothetical protein